MKNKFFDYLERKDIQITFDRIGIKAFSAMAQGLFASLLIGTIINTLGTHLNIPVLNKIGAFAVQSAGAAMAVAIGFALKAPPFVLFSLVAVGMAANSLGGAGGPLAVFFITLIAVFFGKLVSKTTFIDLIVTPAVTIITGVTAAFFLAPVIGKAADMFGAAIMWATDMQPFLMGIFVSLFVGIALTLPISSAALCAALGLTGLAGGAALAGCCAHMVGFAAASFRENKVGGLMAQGLGTSMLQIPNLMKKPVLWIPAISASLISGPLATVVFKIQQNGAPIASGMGTSGMVGPIGVISGWYTPSERAVSMGYNAISPGIFNWISLIAVCLIIPAIVSFIVSELMRKKGLILEGDLKIDI